MINSSPSASEVDSVFAYFRELQDSMVGGLSVVERAGFESEEWSSALGAGRGLFVQAGSCFERAGVNYSCIAASALPPAASERYPQLVGQPYRAGGVSLVIHPQNPYCPTVHMNVRFFVAGSVFWFGGGMDLTPYYGFVEDCQHFHGACRNALLPLDDSLYPRFKKNCDDYFVIRHRNEARGIGGVFFDDFNERSFEHAFAVVRAVGDSFLTAYCPIVQRRRELPFGEAQRAWQQHRRGRYVEFNLVYDRGTLFGLQAGGRAESILMSLPPSVRWGRLPLPLGEEENRLLTDFLPPREWV